MRIVRWLRCVSAAATRWRWRSRDKRTVKRSGTGVSEVIGVVGAGTMGNGIAQVAARAGYNAILHDVREEFVARGFAAIDKSLQRDVEKERISADEKQRIVGRIRGTTDLTSLSEATLVIEAVVEDLAVKTEVFKLLDKITPSDA